LQSVARDLQAYDDIVQRQKLILLASRTETENIELFRDRGCSIWRMSAEEMLLGEHSVKERSRASFVGRTLRAADIRRRAVVTAIDCTDAAVRQSLKA